MPRPSRDQIRNLGDWATTYQWNFEFINTPSGIVVPDGESLNLRMSSSTIPTYTDENKIEINIRGHKVHQPGYHEFSHTIELTLNETVDYMIHQMFSNWSKGQQDPETGVHLPKDQIEGDVRLIRLNRQEEPVWIYNIYGCKLDSYTVPDADSESSNIQPTLTLGYEWFDDGPA